MKNSDGDDDGLGLLFNSTGVNTLVMNQYVSVYNGGVIMSVGNSFPVSGDSQASRSDVGIGVLTFHKLTSNGTEPSPLGGFQRVAPPGLGHIILRAADWAFGAVLTVYMYGQPHRYIRLTANSTVSVTDAGAPLTGHIAAARYDA
jgi:hypothetical protein